MKTSALIALAGVVAVVAVAGLVVATSPGAQNQGSQAGYGGGSGMMGDYNSGYGGGGMMGGGMMSGGHMYQNQWGYQSGDNSGPGACHDYEWNNSYDYDSDGCPCR